MMKMTRRNALALIAASVTATANGRLFGQSPIVPAMPAGRVATSAERGLAAGPIYVIALGWPADGKLHIKTLARNSGYVPSEITKVEMLGESTPLPFERNADALVVSMHGQKPNDIAYGFRISAANLGMTM